MDKLCKSWMLNRESWLLNYESYRVSKIPYRVVLWIVLQDAKRNAELNNYISKYIDNSVHWIIKHINSNKI